MAASGAIRAIGGQQTGGGSDSRLGEQQQQQQQGGPTTSRQDRQKGRRRISSSKRREAQTGEEPEMRATKASLSPASSATCDRVWVLVTPSGNDSDGQDQRAASGGGGGGGGAQLKVEAQRGDDHGQASESVVLGGSLSGGCGGSEVVVACSSYVRADCRDMNFTFSGGGSGGGSRECDQFNKRKETLKDTKVELRGDGTKVAKIVEEASSIEKGKEIVANSRVQPASVAKPHPQLKHLRSQAISYRERALQGASGSSGSISSISERPPTGKQGKQRETTSSLVSWKEKVNNNNNSRQPEDVDFGQEIVRVLDNSDWTNRSRRDDGNSSKQGGSGGGKNNKISTNNNNNKLQHEQGASSKQELELADLQQQRLHRPQQRLSEQQRRRAQHELENGPSPVGQLDEREASTTVLTSSDACKSKVEKRIATYLRQSFYSKNLTWQTNLIGRQSSNENQHGGGQTDQEEEEEEGETEESDVANYDIIGREISTKGAKSSKRQKGEKVKANKAAGGGGGAAVSGVFESMMMSSSSSGGGARRQRPKARTRSISSGSRSNNNRRASTESDTIVLVTSDDTNKQVLTCATAAIMANFSPGKEAPATSAVVGASGCYREALQGEKTKSLESAASRAPGGQTIEAKQTTSYSRRTFFAYPSFSQQSSATSGTTTTATNSGKTLSLSLSDAFDGGSGNSRTRLTTTTAAATTTSSRRNPVTRQASLRLSIENLRKIVERNLVATLIGVYILVSLTVIVLILPYIINVPREIKISNLAKEGEEVGASSTSARQRQQEHQSSQTSTGPGEEASPYKEVQDKSTQTNSADTAHGGAFFIPLADSSSSSLSAVALAAASASLDPQLAAGNVETLIKSHIAVPRKKVVAPSQQQQRHQQSRISSESSNVLNQMNHQISSAGALKSKVLSRRNDSVDDGEGDKRQPVAAVAIPSNSDPQPPPMISKQQQDVKRRGTKGFGPGASGQHGANFSSILSPAQAAGAPLQTGGSTRPDLQQQARPHYQQQQQQQQQRQHNRLETNQTASERADRVKFHDLWNLAHNQQCQPMKIPFCSKSLDTMFTGFGQNGAAGQSSAANQQLQAAGSLSHMAYDKTLLPNQFTKFLQSQAERALQRYEPIIDIKCYALMPLFLCSIYAPKCIQINETQVEKLQQATNSQPFWQQLLTSPPSPSQPQTDDPEARGATSSRIIDTHRPSINIQSMNVGPQQQQHQHHKHGGAATTKSSSSWARLVPPCRSLCKEAFRKCMFFFEVLSLKLLDPEDCESLPESSDSSICVGQLENKLLQRATESENCQEDRFRCTDGECIPKNWRCDGFADCTDRSDEEKCSKCNGSTQFYCGQDTCINKEAVCNGIAGCRDGRDERQCLRLAPVEGLSSVSLPSRFESHRQLEVWSAVKESWVPVCGAQWSAMPMSHEACQALGYSRANETLILFGPAQQKVESRPLFGQQPPNQRPQNDDARAFGSQPSSPPTSAAAARIAARSADNPIAEVRKTNSSEASGGSAMGAAAAAAGLPFAQQRPLEAASKAFGSGGWFDLSSFTVPAGGWSALSADAADTADTAAAAAAAAAASSSASASAIADDDDNERQLVGIVEDIESASASGVRMGRAERADHTITYERRLATGGGGGGAKSTAADSRQQAELLKALAARESKWKSLTSMLYHGPDSGCLGRPAPLVSTVNLQCQNFQCGRPITSYSSRVRQLQQQQRQQQAAALASAAASAAAAAANAAAATSSAGGGGGGSRAGALKRPLAGRASFRSGLAAAADSSQLEDQAAVAERGVWLQRRHWAGGVGVSERKVQKLEALEELDPLALEEEEEEADTRDEDYNAQEQPDEASEPAAAATWGASKVQAPPLLLPTSSSSSSFAGDLAGNLGANDDDYDDNGGDDDDGYNDDDNQQQLQLRRRAKTNDDNEEEEELLLIDKLARNQPEPLDSRLHSRFVVGGTESMPGEFPYLAALHGGPDEVFFCGGVLISINWLLTASHCVGNRTQPDGWMVKVGVTRRIASPAFVRKLKLRKIIKHPNFNKDSLFNNDIALILLEESVEFNQYLRPICLPRANLRLGPNNSKDCVVVGFGKSKFSQEANYLHVAHFVNVPIVEHSICSNWYNEHGVNLTEGMLCAGYAEGKRDACQGDSGSGLFCRHLNTNQFFVAGVVSFGIKCATPKLPGVYTSVPTYVDWIESTTREHGYPLT